MNAYTPQINYRSAKRPRECEHCYRNLFLANKSLQEVFPGEDILQHKYGFSTVFVQNLKLLQKVCFDNSNSARRNRYSWHGCNINLSQCYLYLIVATTKKLSLITIHHYSRVGRNALPRPEIMHTTWLHRLLIYLAGGEPFHSYIMIQENTSTHILWYRRTLPLIYYDIREPFHSYIRHHLENPVRKSWAP